MAYLPTISHLRAYLAVLLEPESRSLAKEGTRTPLLLVFGILSLHRDTSEWSAQGLGSTMASLVEGGSRCGYGIVMCEEDVISEDFEAMEALAVADGEGAMDDELQRRVEETRTSHWREEMPILNGSARRLVAGGDETTGWAGRTVEVGRVLQRWCIFREE